MGIISKRKISTTISPSDSAGRWVGTQQLSGQIGPNVVFLRDHAKLTNLNWLNSGHTGFAGIEFGTTAEWASFPDYIPPAGMLVVYTDYKQTDDGQGNITLIPGIKIGDGNAYLVDKPFVTDAVDAEITEHINDMVKHITQNEREFWNNKLNYVEPESDLLEFTRN